MTLTGKCSTFGGPRDTGVFASEGLALIEPPDLNEWWFRYLFLRETDPTAGLARNLDPDTYYCAMRWEYPNQPRSMLRFSFVRVSVGGRHVYCRPVDWGPNSLIDRIIDLSPGAARRLQVKTDDIVRVELLPPLL